LATPLILYLGFLRTTDRRAEADRHEVRMRAVPPERLPSVDVYIPTYNEPLDVVEKSIVGALSLDYPNLAVWVARRRPTAVAEGVLRGEGCRVHHAWQQRPRQGRQHQSRAPANRCRVCRHLRRRLHPAGATS